MNIGIVGCGNICPIYLENLLSFRRLNLAGVADLSVDRAKERAEAYNVKAFASPTELIGSDQVDLVVNLTTPEAHFDVAKQAILACKHVYNEKPLTLRYQEALELLSLAAANGVRIGCAPDTFLGAGLQACIGAIRRGDIGEPVAAESFMMCHGHEGWHPDPEFYYKIGGGPLFDMGPYYLTALVAMLGPVAEIVSLSRITFAERDIRSEPKRGQKILVETPTHISTSMRHVSGAIGTMIMSFDVWHHRLPNIEVHGTEGSLIVPDPNGFGGSPLIRLSGDSEWREIETGRNFADDSRGLGVLDMADAIENGRAHLASGDLAAHVVEVMELALASTDRGQVLDTSSAPPQTPTFSLLESTERKCP